MQVAQFSIQYIKRFLDFTLSLLALIVLLILALTTTAFAAPEDPTELTGTNSTANFGENYVYAEAIIQTLLYAREKYKGSGNPDFLCTPHLVNVMLLARDLNGRRIYDNVNELKAALNVNEIITAEQFEEKTRTKDSKTYELLGILVNFDDYSLGATKGGEITHFQQFDINFNQEVSLLETRCSGSLTRPFSAIALETEVAGG